MKSMYRIEQFNGCFILYIDYQILLQQHISHKYILENHKREHNL